VKSVDGTQISDIHLAVWLSSSEITPSSIISASKTWFPSVQAFIQTPYMQQQQQQQQQ
jgi:hypothetical protein